MQEITIHKDGAYFATIECYPNDIFQTKGGIGYNIYASLKELLLGLQGFDIAMDDLFF